MNAGILILCRYSSSRLPGKILKKINGKPILGHIVDRLRRSSHNPKIVVTTSNDPSDDVIAAFCLDNEIECFRGDLKNVARRFLECAEHYKLDYAVRVNGDNLLIEISLLDEMLRAAENSQFDFVTNVPGRTFPFGMSIEILKVVFYKKIINLFSEERFNEHVTLYLYENESIGSRFVFLNEKNPEAKGLKLAVDTEEDFLALSKMYELLPDPLDYSLEDILNVYNSIK